MSTLMHAMCLQKSTVVITLKLKALRTIYNKNQILIMDVYGRSHILMHR